MRRDPYEVLGVARDADDTEIKKTFRRARARAPPGREPPRSRGGGEVQGGGRGLRDPLRRRAPRDLRPLRVRGARLARLRVAGARLRLVRGHLRRLLRRRPVRRGVRPRRRRARSRAATSRWRSRSRSPRRRPGKPSTWPTRSSTPASTATGTAPSPGTPIETCPTVRRRRAAARGHPHRVRPARARAGVRHLRRRGQIASEPCHECGGRGRRAVRKTLQVDVPAGIADEQRIRLSGRGHAGERGGPPGDLYVLVRVAEDERFLRDGSNLVTVVDVPAPAAALGTKVTVPTLDGERGDRGARRDAARHGGHAPRARDADGRARPPRRPAGGPERGDPAQPDRAPERAARGAARLAHAENLEEQADESLLAKVKRALR